MKRIKYIFLSAEINTGTEEAPEIKQIFILKDFIYSEEGEEAAKVEAYNGIYEIYEDGEEEPVEPQTLEQRTAALEEAITLLLEGATE